MVIFCRFRPVFFLEFSHFLKNVTVTLLPGKGGMFFFKMSFEGEGEVWSIFKGKGGIAVFKHSSYHHKYSMISRVYCVITSAISKLNDRIQFFFDFFSCDFSLKILHKFFVRVYLVSFFLLNSVF